MPDLTLDVNGPVHVVDHGGDGPAMLLVHGLGGSLLDWRDVAGPLARTHHVWSLDLIGFGRTPLAGRAPTIAANQEAVDGVAEHAGGGSPVVLVGNSMGGLISIVEAARRPHRVAALVLVDPALPRARASRVGVVAAAAFMIMAAPPMGPWLMGEHTRRRGAERLVDDVLRLCTVDMSRVSSETRHAQVDLTRWRYEQGEPDRAFLEAARSLLQWLWHRSSVESHIRRVRAPTLLVHGDRDDVVSVAAAASVASLRSDWSFRVLADTGHIPQMERPAGFVELVAGWLEGTQPAAPVPTSRR
ncbi:MAG: alpha/beta fold hydrolase [Candidatus Dormibacteria bacterium]